MTLGDLLLGLLVGSGFFVSAIVGRIFRGWTAGVIFGGVAGCAVSVFVLVYGLNDLFPGAPTAAEN